MREIKFRGMAKKGWIYGDLIHNRGKSMSTDVNNK